MKKIIGFLSLVAVVSIVACSDRTTEVKKESSTPVIVVKEPVEKPAVIILDKNGAKVVTKKLDVTVKKQ